MNTLVIGADALSGSLAKCKDGEEGEFVIKGTLKMVGDGAVVTGEVSKKGYKSEKASEDGKEEKTEKKPAKMSPAAAAVVNRRRGQSDY